MFFCVCFITTDLCILVQQFRNRDMYDVFLSLGMHPGASGMSVAGMQDECGYPWGHPYRGLSFNQVNRWNCFVFAFRI